MWLLSILTNYDGGFFLVRTCENFLRDDSQYSKKEKEKKKKIKKEEKTIYIK